MLATTKLEDYFEFLSEDDIRLKGHRIGIENVIKYYLQGYTPEERLTELPSLNEEVNIHGLRLRSTSEFILSLIICLGFEKRLVYL